MNELIRSTVMFGVVLTVLSYYIGTRIRRRFGWAILNPLLIAMVISIAVLMLLDIDYETYNSQSQMIRGLLTPATVSLAVPLYNQIHLLRKDSRAIIAGVAAGVAASLLGIFVLSKLFALSYEEFVTLLPKSITTAIGIGVADELGGVSTITVAAIIVTGLLGGTIADPLLKLLRINHPVAKGVAIGTSAHAVGTAKAMEMGEVEGAMSSLAIVVAGLLTVIGASVIAGMY